MEEKTCCVTGHRDIPDEQMAYVKEGLRRAVEQAIQDGYTRFLSGFAVGADLCFAEIVAEKCRENPALRLEAVIPYRKRFLALERNEDTRALLGVCTNIEIIREEYRPDVYRKRNRFMVEQSARVIAVYDGRKKGGTAATIHLAHAMQKELREIFVGRYHIPGGASRQAQNSCKN